MAVSSGSQASCVLAVKTWKACCTWKILGMAVEPKYCTCICSFINLPWTQFSAQIQMSLFLTCSGSVSVYTHFNLTGRHLRFKIHIHVNTVTSNADLPSWLSRQFVRNEKVQTNSSDCRYCIFFWQNPQSFGEMQTKFVTVADKKPCPECVC